MKRKIFCIFLNHISEGLEIKIYPGKLGEIIYKNISKKAWSQWMKRQTIIINEKKLSMINQKDRNYLKKEMIKFLFKKKY